MVGAIVTAFVSAMLAVGLVTGSVVSFWFMYLMVRESITGDPEMWGKRMFDRVGGSK